MEVATGWTGRNAQALQTALRLSNEAFAAQLGIAVRTVAAWHKKPDLRPRTEMQQLLDTALARAEPAARDRFAELIGQPVTAAVPVADAPADDETTAEAENRLIADPNIGLALSRLDQLADWEPGTARRLVAAKLGHIDCRNLLDRASRRSRIGQRHIAQALDVYYRGQPGNYGQYGARCQATEITTSILTHPDWLDLDCPLSTGYDRLTLVSAEDSHVPLGADAADAAIQRLAETLTADTRFVETPLYRLAELDVAKGKIGGSVAVARFADYALTLDLLEGELADALTAGVGPTAGLPLRDRYLPDLASVTDVAGRLCAGGALALCAFARPAAPYRGEADYLLLVQERSGSVINAARRLAVIPKGFHQPMTDYRNDARIAVTLLREMEEELFGREDIDNTATVQNAADPLHPARLSEPMRWLLLENPGALRMECTGFGLNLVSGNYEFACLIVVDSDAFWSRYGGLVQANWEASAMRQYSSLDKDSLSALADDDAWSNEGLFALLQGLRRLQAIGGDRVDIPAIEWTVGS
jgi:hypothetical protein